MTPPNMRALLTPFIVKVLAALPPARTRNVVALVVPHVMVWRKETVAL